MLVCRGTGNSVAHAPEVHYPRAGGVFITINHSLIKNNTHGCTDSQTKAAPPALRCRGRQSSWREEIPCSPTSVGRLGGQWPTGVRAAMIAANSFTKA